MHTITKSIFLTIAFPIFMARAAMAMNHSELLSAINNIRKSHRAKILKANSKLQLVAYKKLKDIREYKYWSHKDDLVTNTSWTNLTDQIGHYGILEENLARDVDDPNNILVSWLNSTEYKKNLLEKKYNEVGIAIGDINYDEGIKRVVVVQFGKKYV